MAEAKGDGVKKRSVKPFPTDTLEEALAIPSKILDERAGQPFHRILLAEALGIKPSSSNYRQLLSSSYKYGLTEGTEKSDEVSLTPTGAAAAQSTDATSRRTALRKAALTPDIFAEFYNQYKSNKLPSPDLMAKILSTSFKVPEAYSAECAQIIIANGKFAGLIRDVSGSAYVIMDAEPEADTSSSVDLADNGFESPEYLSEDRDEALADEIKTASQDRTVPTPPPDHMPRAIFIGHGKNHGPLERLQKILTSFGLPSKVVQEEANLGRPIPQKVRETMLQCGSAILIFTKDEKFFDEHGNEVWRPSENVVHELGAASYAYEDRVVIFKEEGIHFPTNYSNIGYIEFEENNIEAKTMELFKELRDFGLIRITTT